MFASISLSLHIHCTVLITTNTGHWCSKSRKHTATSLYQWFLHMWQHLPEGLISAFAPPEVRWTSSLCWSITKLSHRTSLQIFTNTICSAWLTEHYKELSFLYLTEWTDLYVCWAAHKEYIHFFPFPLQNDCRWKMIKITHPIHACLEFFCYWFGTHTFFFVIFVVELFCQNHISIKTACKAF